MFIVKHDLTHYEWQTATKDELLMELDVLIAKHRKRGTKETIVIEQFFAEGKLLDSITLELPTNENIDERLSNFGIVVVNEPRQSRFGFLNSFKRTFSRFKREKKTQETTKQQELEEVIPPIIPQQPIEENIIEERDVDTSMSYMASNHKAEDTEVATFDITSIPPQQGSFNVQESLRQFVLEIKQADEDIMQLLEAQKQRYQRLLNLLESIEG